MPASAYAIWEASRGLMSGRRLDSGGRRHGWTHGSYHEEPQIGPRECLNGVIALAESELDARRAPLDYSVVWSKEARQVKHALAETIREKCGDTKLFPFPPEAVGDDTAAIAWFNDTIGTLACGQRAMDLMLDLTEERLFEIWWNDAEFEWSDVVEEATRLDEVLPLA